MRSVPVIAVLAVALVVGSLPIAVEGWNAARRPLVSVLTVDAGGDEESRTGLRHTPGVGVREGGDARANGPARPGFIREAALAQDEGSDRRATNEATSTALQGQSSPVVPTSPALVKQPATAPTAIVSPTSVPTRPPSVPPSAAPSPTTEPARRSTPEPSAVMTPVPTAEPTGTSMPEPTAGPTEPPTVEPTEEPTATATSSDDDSEPDEGDSGGFLGGLLPW